MPAIHADEALAVTFRQVFVSGTSSWTTGVKPGGDEDVEENIHAQSLFRRACRR
jgi:hypothetical protein